MILGFRVQGSGFEGLGFRALVPFPRPSFFHQGAMNDGKFRSQ